MLEHMLAVDGALGRVRVLGECHSVMMPRFPDLIEATVGVLLFRHAWMSNCPVTASAQEVRSCLSFSIDVETASIL